ncbi:MAG TPA: adenosine-specific kinase [Syntrophorhabdales bacterium]|nr:adenosine-specific kinase [Syntrophorhabdales bacterium]
MEIKTVAVEIPEGMNVIIGQSHFIKTVPDLYETLVASSPHLKFGVAFSEASGHCLVRHEGNDEDLEKRAIDTAFSLSCGHVFVIFLKDGFPINVLNAIKGVQEICRIFCATANPLQVIVASTEQGNGVMGVIDGARPKGIEDEAGKAWRKDLLVKFKYKL